MKEVEIKPNEKIVITFTNHVPENAPENDYTYRFSLIEITDSGPIGSGGDQTIITYVTHDEHYFNFSQSADSHLTTFSYSSGPSSGFSRDLLFPFAGWLFIAWIIITLIYGKRCGIEL
jgi:hypothetical protein